MVEVARSSRGGESREARNSWSRLRARARRGDHLPTEGTGGAVGEPSVDMHGAWKACMHGRRRLQEEGDDRRQMEHSIGIRVWIRRCVWSV